MLPKHQACSLPKTVIRRVKGHESQMQNLVGPGLRRGVNQSTCSSVGGNKKDQVHISCKMDIMGFKQIQDEWKKSNLDTSI